MLKRLHIGNNRKSYIYENIKKKAILFHLLIILKRNITIMTKCPYQHERKTERYLYHFQCQAVFVNEMRYFYLPTRTDRQADI